MLNRETIVILTISSIIIQAIDFNNIRIALKILYCIRMENIKLTSRTSGSCITITSQWTKNILCYDRVCIPLKNGLCGLCIAGKSHKREQYQKNKAYHKRSFV